MGWLYVYRHLECSIFVRFFANTASATAFPERLRLPNGKHNFNFDHYTVAAAAKEDGHDVYRVVMGET